MDFQIQQSQPHEAEVRTGKRSRDWESHLPKIKRLRFEERKPVKEIIVILKDEDNFVASEREYKEKLAQDVRKNLKKEEKIQIALKQYERLLKYNKRSVFYLGDQVVDMRKIERYMKSNELRVENIYRNTQDLSALLPPSISVCTPPSSPILEATYALPQPQLPVDSTAAVAKQFERDTDSNIEDVMLSLSLEDSAASSTLPQTMLQNALAVSRSSSVQFRSFWTQFRSDTKSGSLYACEMSLKSQASFKNSLLSVASRGGPCIPSFSTPPLSKVMDEWERNDLSRTKYPCTKVPSGANGTIYPCVTTLGRDRSKDYFDAEPVGVAVNTEMQEDDQGSHFFFEQDIISKENIKSKEDEKLKKSELHLERPVGAISMYGVGDSDRAVPLPFHRQDGDSEDVLSVAPLSYVIEGGRTAAIQLQEKPNPLNSNDQYSLKPLWQAVARGHKTFVKHQLDTNKLAKLDLEDKDGRTLLSWAAANGDEAVVELFLERGADVETKDYNGWTPLLWATKNGHEAVVQLLLEKSAELETKDNYGRTALSWAAVNGREAVVKLLLKKGAELETRDIFGETPLSQAAANGHETVVKLLLQKSAKELQ